MTLPSARYAQLFCTTPRTGRDARLSPALPPGEQLLESNLCAICGLAPDALCALAARSSTAILPGSTAGGYILVRKCVDFEMAVRKRSIQTSQVLQALLDAPQGETYGFELVKVTGLPSGSVYPILRRLEEEELLCAREELINPGAKRPRYRIFYRLTPQGRHVAREATREKAVALRSLNPGWHI